MAQPTKQTLGLEDDLEPYPFEIVGGSSHELAAFVSQASKKLHRDPAFTQTLNELLDLCIQQEAKLQQAIELCAAGNLGEALSRRLATQLRGVEHSRSELLNVLSGVVSVWLVGTPLLQALSAKGWLTEGSSSKAGPSRRRRLRRYRLIYKLVPNATWLVNQQEWAFFDAEVQDVNEAGLSFLCDRFLPKGACLRMPFMLGEFQAVVTLRVANAQQGEDRRWRMGAVFVDA